MTCQTWAAELLPFGPLCLPFKHISYSGVESSHAVMGTENYATAHPLLEDYKECRDLILLPYANSDAVSMSTGVVKVMIT